MISPDFVTRSHRKTYDSHYSPKSIENKQYDSFNTIFSTATAELQNVVRLPTGCKSLDNLLDGGITDLVVDTLQ
jgi:RecA/RadA recombinase